MSDEYAESIQKLNLRIDEIEKLMKLLLVNHLLEDTEYIVQEVEEDKRVNPEIQEAIRHYGLEVGSFENMNNIEILNIYISSKTKISIKDLKLLCSLVKDAYPNIEPFFRYQSINGMQRKRILQENISFGVNGKEIHVSYTGEKGK